MSTPIAELLHLARLLDRPSSSAMGVAPIVRWLVSWIDRTVVGASDEAAQATVGLVAAHFRQHGLDVGPEQVLVMDGGIKSIVDSFLHAVMLPDHGDNYLLVPAGFDRSLVGDLRGYGSDVVLKRFTEQVLRDDWLVEWAHDDDQIVLYVPLVNHLTGQVLTRERARGIARAVLRYNQERGARRPVWVVADDSEVGSCHFGVSGARVQRMATITGADLGDGRLGRMADWTLTVVSPARAVGLKSSDVAFAVVPNQDTRLAMDNRAGKHDQLADELVSAVALYLTPRSWLGKGNSRARQNLELVRLTVARMNRVLGFEAVKVSRQTTGGRHTALYLHSRVYEMPTDRAIFQLTWCDADSAAGDVLAYRELFTWHYSDADNRSHRPLTLRVNLDVPAAEFVERVAVLELALTALSAGRRRELRGEYV
nr:hypothetical protein [Kibdelosporangium sp. MJ126-NF4]CEL18593.1 hypothetical protein [Kibdelosporangium sp. MJ126-NF4]CTQ98078.1 hypothetical protein [Kibdelosporangium sp. MJ126-NF4]